IAQREALIDDEMFSYNWDSQSVNPYVGVEIPMTRDIDVTGYVAPVKGVVTSNYGYRPRFGRMHRGIDLNLNVGDTVVSAFDGVVRLTKFERRGYGYYVVVRHDNGLETVYGHLSAFLVKPNQRVSAGQPIALGGNTGRSTGPHLHFETRFLGLAVNPAALIDFENYVTHKDVFTFDKTAYEKSQKYGPVKKGRKAKASKSSKKRKSKASASAKTKKKTKKSGRRS
ncbi:MAG: M23 family metallopeptidase, partial [Prevotella sp.]|nr:M23 family metallopeptidase [Prevotella sp.]